MSESAAIDSLVLLFSQAVNVKFTFVAAITLQLYDIAINLADETTLIWRQRWSVGKVLYLLTRYTALFDAVILLWYNFYPGHAVDTCRLSYTIAFWSMVIGIICSEVVLILRTYAIWGQNLIVLVYLGSLQVVIIILSIRFNYEAVKSITFVSSPLPAIVSCLPISGNGKMSIAYCCVMVAEINVLVLSLYKGLSQWKRDSTPLVHTLYRDGVLYFAVLFSITVANAVIIIKMYNTPYYYILTEMQRVLHSILASHLIMNVRRVAAAATAGSHHEYIVDTNVTNSKSRLTESLGLSTGLYSGSREEHFELR